MGFYPPEVVDDIRTGNDIVDYIGQYVDLKRSGSSYVGLCPFHNEKTPSFHVNRNGQFFHCFGCGAGGDVIGFTMRYNNLSYPEAIKYLADRINYILPEVSVAKDYAAKKELRQNLYEIHRVAAQFYYKKLNSDEGRLATEYLDKREVSLGIRRKFGLGYSPSGSSSLYNELRSKGFSDDIIMQSGLCTDKGKGIYDKFFNRLMFPIIDIYGNIIGFGGRVLGDGMPKYLNSPETEIFNKSRNLYNLNNAKSSKSRELILVEGYMDAIAIYQAGFENVVASLGTAFNANHARVLKAHADSVILLFDSDEAGVQAVLRAIPVMENAGLRIRVLQVHDAKDPDEFIKKFGPSEFGLLLDSAENHIIFQAKYIQKQHDLTKLDERIAFSKEIAKLLSGIDSKIEKNAYLDEISKISDIDVSAIQTEMENIKKGVAPVMLNRTRAASKGGLDDTRKTLISFLVSGRKYYDALSGYVKPEEFLDDFYVKTAKYIYSLYEQGKPVSRENIISFFETIEEQEKITELFVECENFTDNMTDGQIEKAVNDMFQNLKQDYYQKMTQNAAMNGDMDLLVRMADEKTKLRGIHITLSDH